MIRRGLPKCGSLNLIKVNSFKQSTENFPKREHKFSCQHTIVLVRRCFLGEQKKTLKFFYFFFFGNEIDCVIKIFPALILWRILPLCICMRYVFIYFLHFPTFSTIYVCWFSVISKLTQFFPLDVVEFKRHRFHSRSAVDNQFGHMIYRIINRPTILHSLFYFSAAIYKFSFSVTFPHYT